MRMHMMQEFRGRHPLYLPDPSTTSRNLQDVQIRLPPLVMVVTADVSVLWHAQSMSVSLHSAVSKDIGLLGPQSFNLFGSLLQKCQGREPIPVAVCWPCSPVSLAGAIEAAEIGLIEPQLIGLESDIRTIAASSGLDIAAIEAREWNTGVMFRSLPCATPDEIGHRHYPDAFVRYRHCVELWVYWVKRLVGIAIRS